MTTLREREVICTDGPVFVVTGKQRATIGRKIRTTAWRFHVRLSRECVEDFVQEVLLRLWQFGVYGKLTTCPAYVRRVAERTVIDAIRRRHAKKRTVRPVSHVALHGLAGEESQTPEELLIEREELRLLVEWCRVQFPQRLFLIFSLVYLTGLPRKEVGRRVGLSRGSVDAALFRIRVVLQERGWVRKPPVSSEAD